MGSYPGYTVIRELMRGDTTPEKGEWVALGCPLCTWTSSPSQSVQEPNGAWHALQAVQDEWSRHYVDRHRPAPRRLVVEPWD